MDPRRSKKPAGPDNGPRHGVYPPGKPPDYRPLVYTSGIDERLKRAWGSPCLASVAKQVKATGRLRRVVSCVIFNNALPS